VTLRRAVRSLPLQNAGDVLDAALSDQEHDDQSGPFAEAPPMLSVLRWSNNRISCTCGWSHHYTATFRHVARCNAEWMAIHLRDVGKIKATVVAGNGFTEWPAAEPKEECSHAATRAR
jgi:hypothetical protein